MRCIAKIEHPDIRVELLWERKRLAEELKIKRTLRDEMPRGLTNNGSAVDENITSEQLSQISDEIENLQIKFMDVYRKTLCWHLAEDANQANKNAEAAHIPPLPNTGSIVLKAIKGFLVHGIGVEPGESFSVDIKTARQLLEGNKVIVNERHLTRLAKCL